MAVHVAWSTVSAGLIINTISELCKLKRRASSTRPARRYEARGYGGEPVRSTARRDDVLVNQALVAGRGVLFPRKTEQHADAERAKNVGTVSNRKPPDLRR